MSDSFEMLVDAEVTPDKAAAVARKVIAALRKAELITGRLSSDCVLGGKGYPVGPGAARHYRPGKGELKFWQLVTSGVELRVGRGFNEWALIDCDMKCPKCHKSSLDFAAITDSLKRWVHGKNAKLACPKCGKSSTVESWRSSPPLGFGNLAFTFWNWPTLTSNSWQIDVIELVRSATDHKIVSTSGRI